MYFSLEHSNKKIQSTVFCHKDAFRFLYIKIYPENYNKSIKETEN